MSTPETRWPQIGLHTRCFLPYVSPVCALILSWLLYSWCSHENKAVVLAEQLFVLFAVITVWNFFVVAMKQCTVHCGGDRRFADLTTQEAEATRGRYYVSVILVGLLALAAFGCLLKSGESLWYIVLTEARVIE